MLFGWAGVLHVVFSDCNADIHSPVAPGRCQSKFVYIAKRSEPDFAAIDFPAFFQVDLSGSITAPSIWNLL
jgi:hypothetical protein